MVHPLSSSVRWWYCTSIHTVLFILESVLPICVCVGWFGSTGSFCQMSLFLLHPLFRLSQPAPCYPPPASPLAALLSLVIWLPGGLRVRSLQFPSPLGWVPWEKSTAEILVIHQSSLWASDLMFLITTLETVIWGFWSFLGFLRSFYTDASGRVDCARFWKKVISTDNFNFASGLQFYFNWKITFFPC